MVTRPRASNEASGSEKVCTPVPVAEVIVKSVPLLEIAKVCPAFVTPFSEEIPLPAPASTPQEKSPVLTSLRSLSVPVLQADSPAPLNFAA